MAYVVGEIMETVVQFRNPETDALVDPDTVEFKYENPDANETTLTYPTANLTKDSTGKYRARVSLTLAGIWTFRWVTSGTYQGAKEFKRRVAPTEF